MTECLSIKYRLTFLIKYLFFRVVDHWEPELVWNHFEMISFFSHYEAFFFTLQKWLANGDQTATRGRYKNVIWFNMILTHLARLYR